MKKNHKNGFTLVMVIVLMSMVAASVALMSKSSGNLAFDTNRQYLKCGRDNLTASAMAWVKLNQAHMPANKNLSLDTASLELPGMLQVKKTGPNGVSINASCHKGHQKLSVKDTYSLESK